MRVVTQLLLDRLVLWFGVVTVFGDLGGFLFHSQRVGFHVGGGGVSLGPGKASMVLFLNDSAGVFASQLGLVGCAAQVVWHGGVDGGHDLGLARKGAVVLLQQRAGCGIQGRIRVRVDKKAGYCLADIQNQQVSPVIHVC